MDPKHCFIKRLHCRMFLCTVDWFLFFNAYHAEYFHLQQSSPIFIELTRRIKIITMFLQAEWKNSVDPDQLASQKPADLD